MNTTTIAAVSFVYFSMVFSPYDTSMYNSENLGILRKNQSICATHGRIACVIIALFYILKLASRLAVIRCQPSISTNRIIFQGSEIITGGSINMPIDINTLATIRSSTTKGM